MKTLPWVIASLTLAALSGCGNPTGPAGTDDLGDVTSGPDLANTQPSPDLAKAPADLAMIKGNDAAGTCAPGQTFCNNSICTDLQTDPVNCGACANVCPNNGPCTKGVCANACPMGKTFCLGNCVDVTSDPHNCGMCGIDCGPGSCSQGQCGPSCPPGQKFCFGTCRDVVSDPANCGGCNVQCPKAGPGAFAACQGGMCTYTCDTNLADCDKNAANGCETDLTTLANCGACGKACPLTIPHGTSVCQGGGCFAQCDSKYMDCNHNPADGCEVDITTTSDCGNCGNACTAGPNATAICTAGGCRTDCNVGFADCNGNPVDGCEVNLQTDDANCGACGATCGLMGTCGAGKCSCALFAYEVPPTPSNAVSMPRDAVAVGMSCAIDATSITSPMALSGGTVSVYADPYGARAGNAVVGQRDQVKWSGAAPLPAGGRVELIVKAGLKSSDGKAAPSRVAQGRAKVTGAGNGFFAPIGTIGAPGYFALGDYNGDGYLDMAGPAELHLGTISGVPSANAAPSYAGLPKPYQGSAVGADVDGDGMTDLVISPYVGNNSTMLFVYWGDKAAPLGARLDTGATNFQPSDSLRMAVGDLNGDGLRDIVGYSEWLGAGYQFTQTAPRNLASKVLSLGTQWHDDLALFDLDRDGDLDLLLVDSEGAKTSRLYSNSGTGTFGVASALGSKYANTASGGYTDVGDVNGDGYPDIVVADGTNVVYLGTAMGTFNATAAPIGLAAARVRLADLDSDGDLDLVNLVSGAVITYLNDGKGAFTKQTQKLTCPNCTYTSFDVADMDRDGSVDIVASDGTYATVWRNGCTGLGCICGNGVVDAGEQCDPGTMGMPYDGMPTMTCNADCTLSKCGDGKINTVAGEQCDLGGAVDLTICAPGCLLPTCTDGLADGTETDVDCGGSCAAKCGILKGCKRNSDCSTSPLPLACAAGPMQCSYNQDFESLGINAVGTYALPHEFTSSGTKTPPGPWLLDTVNFGYIGMAVAPCYPGHGIPNLPLWPIHGNVSAISGPFVAGQKSTIQLTATFAVDGLIRFEEATDWDNPATLTFYTSVGGVRTLVDSWSGRRYNAGPFNARQYTIKANAMPITLIWEVDMGTTPSYIDGCTNTGRAWIDNIYIEHGAVVP